MRNTTDLKTLLPSKSQAFVYRNKFGRIILKLLICKPISKIVGAFLNSPMSKPMIKSFVKNNNIDLSLYENENYNCYNNFFTRKIKLENRVMVDDKNAFISPADSRLLALDITDNLKFKIKNGYYSLDTLLDDKQLADEFSGGRLLIFRLCVDDYHRYCFVDNGKILANKYINGKLHTVQPIALEKDNFFKENSREVTVIQTENFDKIAMVEIGAMMVGKIVNHNTNGISKKGEEKGYFEFGGSTVCVVLKKNAVEIDDEIINNTKNELETRVLFREKIGYKKSKKRVIK